MLGLHPKVQNAGIAGAITVIIVWAAETFGHTKIPPEVASAITLVAMSITGWSSNT